MVKSTLISAILLLSCLFYPAHLLSAGLDTDKAHRLIQQGYESFKNKEYQKAIQFFSASYQIVRHPLRLQNIARCYEMLKQYAPAILFNIEYALQIDRQPEIADTHHKLLNLIPFYASSPELISLDKLQALVKQLTQKGRLKEMPAVFIIAGLASYKEKFYPAALTYLGKGVSAPSIKSNRPVHSITLLTIRVCQEKIAAAKSPQKTKSATITGEEFPLVPPPAQDFYTQKTRGAILMAAGIIGVVVSGLMFYYTKKTLDETDTAYQAYQNTAKTQTDPGVINDAWSAYVDSRDKNKPKAYGLVIAGSILCAGSVAAIILGLYYLQKRGPKNPALSYMERLSVQPVFTSFGKMNGGGVNYQIRF